LIYNHHISSALLPIGLFGNHCGDRGNRGVGRAKAVQHPHIFPSITGIFNDPQTDNHRSGSVADFIGMCNVKKSGGNYDQSDLEGLFATWGIGCKR
jgi:hypothetical protein